MLLRSKVGAHVTVTDRPHTAVITLAFETDLGRHPIRPRQEHSFWYRTISHTQQASLLPKPFGRRSRRPGERFEWKQQSQTRQLARFGTELNSGVLNSQCLNQPHSQQNKSSSKKSPPGARQPCPPHQAGLGIHYQKCSPSKLIASITLQYGLRSGVGGIP